MSTEGDRANTQGVQDSGRAEVTLDQIPVGEKATVVMACDRHDAAVITAQRLLHQGIVTGAVVEVLRRTVGGGRILAVGRSRLALAPQVVRDMVVTAGTPGIPAGDPVPAELTGSEGRA